MFAFRGRAGRQASAADSLARRLDGTVAIGMPVRTRGSGGDEEPAAPSQARPQKRARNQSPEQTPSAPPPASHPTPVLPPLAPPSPTAEEQQPAPPADRVYRDQEVVRTPPNPAADPDLDGSAETEDLCRTLDALLGPDADPEELLEELQKARLLDAGGAEAQPLALPDAAVPGNTPAHFIQLLEAQGELPEAARAGLITFLRRIEANDAAQVTPGTAMLIQGDITPLKVGSSFPHIVELNGALSAEEEACELQQYKSKMTHIKVQLRDEQGAPPPHPCPHSSRLVYT